MSDDNARRANERAINEARGKPHVAPPGGNAPTQITKAQAIRQHRSTGHKAVDPTDKTSE